MNKQFNSLQQVLDFLEDPKGGYFKVYLNNKEEVEILRNKVNEIFTETEDEIEYVYSPNERCNDRGIEWIETFHYLRVMVPLGYTPYGMEYRVYHFDLKVSDF